MVSMKCVDCGTSFWHKKALMNHVRLHHRPNMPISKKSRENRGDKSKFQCSLCWKSLASKTQLESHIQQTHKRKPFRCTSCSFSTHYKRSLKNHVVGKHKPPEYKEHRCPRCGMGFVTKCRLQAHERWHNGQFPITCSQCGKGFLSERDLNRHLPTHKKKSAVSKKQGGFGFKCGQCTEVFAQSDYLKEHQAKKHPKTPKKFPCAKCDFATDHKKNLLRHQQTKHLNLGKKFQCQVCGKSFGSSSNLQRHLRAHTKEKPFTCDQCRKAFTDKSSLTCHVRSVHLKLKPFKCGNCGKTFATKSNLIEHQECERREKVPCPRCGRQMANKRSFYTHLHKMHGDQPMFRCGVCGKGMAFKWNLKIHEEKHLAKPVLID